MLKKKAPFQRIKENPFINPPKLNYKITREFIAQLFLIKAERKKNERYSKLITFVTLIVAAFLIVLMFQA